MNDFYLQRHFKLWEDNNKLLNRIVFLTVILSLALVIKVLIPFIDFSEHKKPVIQSIKVLNKEKQTVNEKIEIIGQTTKVLEDVNKFISQQPWQEEKRDLIKRYRDMRRSPPTEGFSRERYQQEADDTIKKISSLLHKNILTPLEHSVDDLVTDRNSAEQLISEVDSLNQFIENWKKEYISKNWYRTIDRKDLTMYKLTEDLNERLYDFSNVVKRELYAVKRAKSRVDNELKQLNNKISTEADKLQELDDALQEILPEWLQGLVKIEQVIQLLPVALLGAAAFVLALGVRLTKHYTIYAEGEKLTKDITSDPGMSTTWTLIHRGFSGSILTIMAYALFIVFTWLLFERSMALLLDWLAIEPAIAWISNLVFWEAFLWFSRAGFVLLLVFVFIRLRRII